MEGMSKTTKTPGQPASLPRLKLSTHSSTKRHGHTNLLGSILRDHKMFYTNGEWFRCMSHDRVRVRKMGARAK
jgi:hypothetical protein